MVKWLIAIIVFTVAIVPVATPGNVSACSCAEFISPPTAFEKATAVFTGMVISLQGPTGRVISSADPVMVVIQVDTVWKGPQENTLVVTTALSSASCGVEFKIGSSYLIYAHGSEDRLEVGLCEGTKSLILAEQDLNSLGSGITMTASDINLPSEEGNGFNYLAVTALIGGIVIGTVSGVALTRKRYR